MTIISHKLPTVAKKALMKAGVLEKNIPDFISWAFGEHLIESTTFREFCVIWNNRHGDKLWFNIDSVENLEEYTDLFFKMGTAYLNNFL